jgi:hypothetical protein
MNDYDKTNGSNPGYETTDAGVSGIMWSGVGLFALMVFSFILIWFVFDSLSTRHAEETKPTSPLFTGERVLPPEPRLQVVPEIENQAIIAAQDSVIHEYGWASRDDGIVRIPVAEAMKLTVERGLPARQQQ